MGTSTGYNMPKGGDWTPLKRDAGSFVKDEGEGSVSPERLLQQYLHALGGATGLSGAAPSGSSSAGTGGGGGTGGGNSGGGGTGGGGGGRGRARSALKVGRNLGGFLSRVGTVGLTETLREFGLEHLIGRSASELATGLLDALCGPASTIDDGVARAALAELNTELLREARTAEDVERILTQAIDAQGLGGMLLRYFGHYIYARFCRDFYERWVKVVGSVATNGALTKVRNYIAATLRAKTGKRDIGTVNWRGREGGQIIQQVLAETCEVFGVPR